ncbi:hypothetical protein UFOVP245_134 [uncultured Caudovirales phage]|uniref:Uncharacterized protein n=1 Tax=uncultured Caudovirales phage TaxID=2100421 RepID=A0A6J7WWT3_9CAUD|nr:hypothetical protein UFOVP245_134 [uncultured Caudovirales phage]
MASLGDLTKRVATAPFTAVGNIAGKIGSTIKGSISGITGVGSLRPSAIAAATMEAAGIGGLIPATLLASSGGAGKGGSGSKNSTDPGAGSATPTSPMMNTGGMESLLTQLVGINQHILTINQQILSETKKNSKSLDDIVTYFQNKQLSDIENRREQAKQNTAAPGGAPDAAKTPGKGILATLGGIFGGILSFVKDLGSVFSSILKIGGSILSAAGSVLGFFGRIGGFFLDLLKLFDLGKIMGFLGSIGRFFTMIGGALMRLAAFLGGPIIAAITAVVGVLLSLKAEDWTAFAKKFTDAWDALLNGDFLTAIVNTLTAIPELIIKGLGRLVANIAEFLGFDKAAKAINEWVDNFDLGKIVIDALKSIGDMISNGFNAAKDMFTDFWNSFDIITPITDAFNFVLDSVVNLFSSLKDSVSNVINAGADIAKSISDSISSMVNSVWNFFTSLPSKAMDLIGGMIPDSLKGIWNKMFGSKPIESAAPTASAPAQAPATPGNMGSPDQPLSRESIAAVAPATPGATPSAPMGSIMGKVMSASPVLGKPGATLDNPIIANAAAAMGIPATAFAPVANQVPKGFGVNGESAYGSFSSEDFQKKHGFNLSGTGSTEALQKANEASRLGMSQNSAVPTIVNNINNNMTQGGSGGSKTENRTSGAAPTAPVQSHMDRALYGSTFGAGIP